MTPVVSIIVVSYNTREMTLVCLESIRRETRTPFEVLFIDNDSDDGSLEAVRDRFADDDRYVISDNATNLGFAAGNNEMGGLARGEFILLLNPDTVVLDGAVDKILEFAARAPQHGIWGGRTVFADGTLNPTNCWGRFTLWTLFCQTVGLTRLFRRTRLFNPRAYPKWDRTGDREVGIVTGCFFLITTKAWNQLGGFDREFFMYGEEADLCERARAAGARPGCSGDPTIIHHGGASERTRAGKTVKLLDAQVRFFRRHWSRLAFLAGLILMDLMVLLRWGAEVVRRRRSEDRAWSVVWSHRSVWRSGARGGPPLKETPQC